MKLEHGTPMDIEGESMRIIREELEAQGIVLPPDRAAVDRWATEHPGAVFAVGNAPTALLRMAELMEAGGLRPALVIGVPVGFVNVVESKERIWEVCRRMGVPAIAAMGRKGGSTVAAAICNALLYQAAGMRK